MNPEESQTPESIDKQLEPIPELNPTTLNEEQQPLTELHSSVEPNF